ncbi:MAG: GDSL-type esterase/lipase family protein, partial [Anaerolineae bacterium]
IDAADPQGPFDWVSLLIGVNNQYRGLPMDEYRREFAALLARAIEFAGGEPDRVVVVSIPDWGVTPFARANGRNPQTIAAEIDAFNAANREEAERQGTKWVDVTAVSRQHPHLLTADGLHPSAKQYHLWTEKILPLTIHDT